MKTQMNKKLVLNKETLRVLSDDALSRVAGGDSTGASAGRSCECTLRCPKPEPGLTNTAPEITITVTILTIVL